MAKDPAFLFYPNDWMGGTMTLTRHQRGCYMDLLIAQFNNGPLSLETIKSLLGSDQVSWSVLQKKFKQDSEGNFYNERMAIEIDKRKTHSSKQRERIQNYWDKKKQPDTTVIPRNNHGTTGEVPYEIEIEINNELKDEKKFEAVIVPEILSVWKRLNPGYFENKEVDYPACLQIAYNIADIKGWRKSWVTGAKESECLKSWERIASYVLKDRFWSTKTLDTISQPKTWQKIVNDMKTTQTAPVATLIKLR